jgi:cytochrome c oxidase cbb3-type subunit III
MRWRLLALVALVVLPAAAAAQPPMPEPLDHPTAADLSNGAKVFATYCSRCHGFDGTGGMGPPLARPRLRRAHDERGILEILVNGVPGTAMMAAFWLSALETQQVAAYILSLGQRPEEPLPGDAARGAGVYARSGCAACHIIEGAGTGVGPELSDIGALRGAAFLRQSILDPAAARPERPVPFEPYGYPAYLIVRATPRGGSEIVGMRLNEDAFTIQLRDQQGLLHSLRKADLDRLTPEPGTSLMPNYRDVVKGQDLDDLVAYLMTRRADR